MDVNLIIKNTRALLAKKDLSVYALAKLMKGSATSNEPWLNKLLNGKIKTPRLEGLHSIANALQVPIQKIAGKGYEKEY